MADTKSTFLLDQSKRMSANRGLGKWLKYGEIDEACLKGIGFTYKENFEEAHEKLQASLNQALKPLTTILNNLIKASPFGAGTSISGLDDVRAKALEALTLFRAMNSSGSADKDPKNNDEALIEMLQRFDFIYAKHIPLRKSSPGVDIKMGQSIKVNFAYGKANLFNAKEEVWVPLMNIKKILFPSVSLENSELGLIKFNNTAKVPYTTMTLPRVIKQISENWTAFGANASKLNSSAKKLAIGTGGVSDKLSTIHEVLSSIRNPSGTEDSFSKLEKKLRNVLPTDGSSTLLNKITSDSNVYPKLKVEGVASILPPKASYKVETGNTLKKAFGHYKNASGTNAEETFETAYTNALIKNKLVKDPENEKGEEDDVYSGHPYTDATKFKLDGSGKLISAETEKTKAEEEEDAGLEKILENLATVEQRIIGPILNDWAKTVENDTTDFYFGYPQRFCSNVDDFFLTDGPMITLQNVIPTKVSISFDFSNLDEEGYPMAGALEIQEVWSVEVAGGSLHLGTDAPVGTGNGNTTHTINLEESYPPTASPS